MAQKATQAATEVAERALWEIREATGSGAVKALKAAGEARRGGLALVWRVLGMAGPCRSHRGASGRAGGCSAAGPHRRQGLWDLSAHLLQRRGG